MSDDLTFLLTDVEGSTAIWERAPEEMRAALARHDEIIRGAVGRLGGEHKPARGEGDSHFAVFRSPADAVNCATQIQRALAAETWPEGAELSVRIGIHSGSAETRGGDYYGATVNRAARLRAIAHGGQTVMSAQVANRARPLADPDAELRDRGDHRLRDLEEPLRVFELVHAGLRRDFPPLKSLDGRRHNLPIQLTSFIGRDDEIAMVTKLLAEGGRLVTIAGSGGIGKTRLSLQIASELIDEYPDGVWLVELANITDPIRVPQEINAALGVTSENDPLDDLVAFLSSRSALILLDNCEQVVAGAARVVDGLVPECPGVVVLATSREPLGVPGEKILRLAGMPTPDDEHDRLSELSPAVQLFAERAQTVEHGFVLADDNRAAVVRICRRLDGLPLAIELAAARVRVLSPHQIDERLEDRFGLLTGGPRTRDARQQTMRAAIDWSHDLLSPDETALFRRLSVFAGGCTLDAVEAVCARPPVARSAVIDVLGGLVDKSLVVAEPAKDERRYRMLESIRLYAVERLAAAGELAGMKDAHLLWVTARTAVPPAVGQDRAAASVAVFREEADNVRSALDHAVKTDPAAGLVLMWNTMEAWDSYSHFKEGLGRVRDLLERHVDRDAPRLFGLSLLGILARLQGDVDLARLALEEAVEIARERQHDERLVANLVVLGSLSHLDGRVPEGEACLEEAEQVARKAEDLSSLAYVLTGRARMAMERDAARSVALFEEALRLRRDLRDGHHVQTLLENLTSMYERQGRVPEARAAAQEAKELATAAGDEESVTALALSLGRIAQDEGRFEEAEACFREVLTLAREKDMPNEEGFAWALLGENSRALKNLTAAKDCYSRSRDCFDRAGNVVTVSFLSGNLGHIALEEGDLDQARELARSALRIAIETETMSGVVEFLELMAEVETADGRFDTAVRIFGAADELRQEVGAARDLVDQPDYDRAIAAAQAALPEEEYAALWRSGQSEGAAALTARLLEDGPSNGRPSPSA